MGVWNSFKGQIGRDTGRVFSNIVWGDKHASVYRRAEDRKSKRLQLEQEQFDLAKQNAIDDKIEALSEYEITNDRNELINTLAQLTVLLKSNPYKGQLSNDEEKEKEMKNAYFEGILTKYEQTLITLASLYPNDTMLPYYQKKFKRAKRSKYLGKYAILIILAIIILFMAIIIALTPD